MATVKGPLGSMSATKQFGHQLIFQGGPNGTRVKRYKVPTNPRTAAQQANRVFTGPLTRAWKTLGDDYKTLWTPEGSTESRGNYHRYISDNLKRWNTGVAPLAGPGLEGWGFIPVADITQRGWENGKLRLDVDLTENINGFMIGIALLNNQEQDLTTKDFIWLQEISDLKTWTLRLDLASRCPFSLFIWMTSLGGQNWTGSDYYSFEDDSNENMSVDATDNKSLPWSM
jgi:hypothetical protein